MSRFDLWPCARAVGAVLASTAILSLANFAAISRPAAAEPGFVSSYVGVGSISLQDLFDAYSGAALSPGMTTQAVQWYTPLHSSQASKSKTISSFGATDANETISCITTKVLGTTFGRPYDSGDGIYALSDNLTGATWWGSRGGAQCDTTAGNVSGQIDFARSDRDHNAVAGTQLTYIPFARDAISFAYFDHNTGVASALNKTQHSSLYTSPTGSITVGSDTVKACMNQSTGRGSAYWVDSIWEASIGVTDAQAEAASAASGCTANPSSTLTGDSADAFFAFAGTLPPGTDAVVPFSAASWIAQANGTALDRSATARANFVDLGSIDAATGFLGKPYTGSRPNEAPNSTFYHDTTFGHNQFVVVPTAKLSGLRSDPGLVGLISNTAPTPGPAICQTGRVADRTPPTDLAT